jgi:hypothetical protein
MVSQAKFSSNFQLFEIEQLEKEINLENLSCENSYLIKSFAISKFSSEFSNIENKVFIKALGNLIKVFLIS